MRSLAGALIVLFALFIVENYVVRIILAAIAAILAGTAFLRYCPINAMLKRDSREFQHEEQTAMVQEEAPNEPTPEPKPETITEETKTDSVEE